MKFETFLNSVEVETGYCKEFVNDMGVLIDVGDYGMQELYPNELSDEEMAYFADIMKMTAEFKPVEIEEGYIDKEDEGESSGAKTKEQVKILFPRNFTEEEKRAFAKILQLDVDYKIADGVVVTDDKMLLRAKYQGYLEVKFNTEEEMRTLDKFVFYLKVRHEVVKAAKEKLNKALKELKKGLEGMKVRTTAKDLRDGLDELSAKMRGEKK